MYFYYRWIILFKNRTLPISLWVHNHILYVYIFSWRFALRPFYSVIGWEPILENSSWIDSCTLMVLVPVSSFKNKYRYVFRIFCGNQKLLTKPNKFWIRVSLIEMKKVESKSKCFGSATLLLSRLAAVILWCYITPPPPPSISRIPISGPAGDLTLAHMSSLLLDLSASACPFVWQEAFVLCNFSWAVCVLCYYVSV